jgi:hypothetical protein
LNHEDCSAVGTPKNKNLNCASTEQSYSIIASVTTPSDASDVIACDGIADLYAGAWDPVDMPDFWEFHGGGCSGSSNFTASSDFAAFSSCADLWAGRGMGGWQYGGIAGPVPDGNHARIKWAWYVTPENARFLLGGAEHYITRMTFRTGRALDCTGCRLPVCVAYEQETIAQLSGNYMRIVNLDWLNFNDPYGVQFCFTAVEKRSWGSVKSLYR